MYSLNDLHKAAGNDKKHAPFASCIMRNAQTQELIAEIEQAPNLVLGVNTVHGGANRGAYVCKELVYAYAMWISSKFNLQVIRAFDQAQQEAQPEPIQQTLPATIQDDEKLKLINDIAQSLGITENIVVVPTSEIMNMVHTIRGYQTQIAQLQTNPLWVNQTIECVKNATGRHFGGS